MVDIHDLIEDLKKSEVIDKSGYNYIILPFDFKADPHEIRIFSDSLRDLIKKSVDVDSFDKIITIESKGILISTLISLSLNKPLYIIRKRCYNLKGEKEVKKSTGYEESNIYINGIEENDRIIIIDDLISTGGTLKATIKALIEIKSEVIGAFILFDKPDYGGADLIKNKFPSIVFKSLLKLKINENKRVEITL